MQDRAMPGRRAEGPRRDAQCPSRRRSAARQRRGRGQEDPAHGDPVSAVHGHDHGTGRGRQLVAVATVTVATGRIAAAAHIDPPYSLGGASLHAPHGFLGPGDFGP